MKKGTKIIALVAILFYLIIAMSTNDSSNKSSTVTNDNNTNPTKEETQPATNEQPKTSTNQTVTREQPKTTTIQDTVAAKKSSYTEVWLVEGKVYSVPEGKVWIIQGYENPDVCNTDECFWSMFVNNKEYNVLRCKEWKGIQTPWSWDEIKLKTGETVQTGKCVKRLRVFEYNN